MHYGEISPDSRVAARITGIFRQAAALFPRKRTFRANLAKGLSRASAVLVFLAAVLTFLPALGDALRRYKKKRRKR